MTKNSTKYSIEVCVESFSQAWTAQQRGADQIELCSHLEVEGLTPEPDLIKKCLENLSIPVKVMIRPRAGDFSYSRTERDTMYRMIELCQELGVAEIVFGIVRKKSLDIEEMVKMCDYASPIDVTIHKAIDTCDNLMSQLVNLRDCARIKSVLTSGGFKTAEEGKEVIREMNNLVKGQIEIIGAGSIVPENLPGLHDFLGLPAYHGRKILGEL